MLDLLNAKIQGDATHVKNVHAIFGHVTFRGDIIPVEETTFLITKALPNYYRDPKADEDPDESLLYVLVPSRPICTICAGSYKVHGIDDVKYHCFRKDGKMITPAIVISKGKKTLYFCLFPEGIEIEEIEMLNI
jgi:hypothetical protein